MSKESLPMPESIMINDDLLPSLVDELSAELHQFMVDWAEKHGMSQLMAGTVTGASGGMVRDLNLAMIAALAQEAGLVSMLLSQGHPEIEAELDKAFMIQYRSSRADFEQEYRDQLT
jgi:hypothetical protein